MFSVIMPAFNAANTIADSILSVQSQTYTNWELIVVDDGSTDDTKKICESFSQVDPRVRVLDNSVGKGAASARNCGISAATYRYLCFLDSDDLWFANKLELQCEAFSNSSVNFVYSDYILIDENFKGQLTDGEYPYFKAPSKLVYRDLLKSCSIGCLTVAVDKKAFARVSFPNMYKEDYALWLSLLQGGGEAKSIGVATAAYRIRAKSLSSNKWKELFRQKKVLEIFISKRFSILPYYLFCYILSGIFKYRFLKRVLLSF